MAFTTYQTTVAEIAQAAYGRALANTGLDFYAQHLEAGNYTEASLFDEFLTNNEAAIRYPATQSHEDTVNQVFNNVLNRDVATQEGLDFYTARLEAGLTLAELVNEVLSDAKSGGGDQAYLDSKVAEAEAAYTPTSTDEDSDATNEAEVAPGTTYTLTTAANDAVAGTIRADVVNAANGTLQGGDIIADAVSGDNDTMNVETTTNMVGTTPTVTNIETINVNGTYNTVGYDFTNTVGSETLNLSAGISTAAATVTAATNPSVQQINAGDNIQTLTVNSVATSGTQGTVGIDSGSATNLTVNGNTGNDTYDIETTANVISLDATAGGTDEYNVNLAGTTAALTVSDAGIENLNIESTGSANTLNMANTNGLAGLAGGQGVTISGDQDLLIVGDADVISGAGVASGATAITANVRVNNADDYTGTSTFRMNAATTATATNVFVNEAAFDVIEVSADLGATITGELTIADTSTLLLTADTTATAAQTYDIDNNTGTLTTGTLTVDLQASQSTAALTTGGKVAVMDMTINTINPAVIAALDTAATSGNGTVVNTSGAQDLTVTAWTADATDTFSASGLSGNLTITLATALGNTIVGGSGDDTIISIGGADTIIGGAGDDTITGAAGVDTIQGGEGNDTIDGGAGLDSLTGNAGIDIFQFVVTDSGTGAAFDQITDYEAGTDIIDFTATALAIATDATATAGDAAVDANGLATFAAADNTLALKIAALVGSTGVSAAAGNVAIFEHGSNTYLYVDGGTPGNDVIQLTGITGATEITISGGDITSIA